MTSQALSSAVEQAKAQGLIPLLFKIRVSTLLVTLAPTWKSTHKPTGLAIDVTSGGSHLLCWGGKKIPIEGEW